MTFVVTEACKNCKDTSCVNVCPTEAFHEGPDMLYINPDSCIDCGGCVPECPVDAIYDEEELPKKFAVFKELNRIGASQNPVISQSRHPLG